jgi:hypothetical protein
MLSPEYSLQMKASNGVLVGSGWDTNPVMQKNPPVNVPGTRYGVYSQEQAATEFSEGNVGAVQSDLMALGYEWELVACRGEFVSTRLGKKIRPK